VRGIRRVILPYVIQLSVLADKGNPQKCSVNMVYNILSEIRIGNLQNTSHERCCLIQHAKYFFLIRKLEGGVPIGSTRHVGHLWTIVPAPGECEDEELYGTKIGRGNRSTRRKLAPAPLCPPQIPLDQTSARTRVAAVRSQRLTT
jgi:hypothetical protein